MNTYKPQVLEEVVVITEHLLYNFGRNCVLPSCNIPLLSECNNFGKTIRNCKDFLIIIRDIWSAKYIMEI